MSNDNERNFNVPNARQKQAIRSDDEPTKTDKLSRNAENFNGVGANELRQDAQESESLEAFVSALNKTDEEKLIHLLVEERQWSGLLPDPNTFNLYSKDVQKSIISWNDATIIDGSKRETELVNEFVKHRKWAQIFSFLINFSIPIAGIAAFVITGDHACLTSLGVPVISIGVNVWKNKKDEQE